MAESVFGLPLWFVYLVIAITLTYGLVLGGWVLAKAGRSPVWVLLLLVPYVNVIAVWAFAYARWPFVDGARAAQDGTADEARRGIAFEKRR